MPRNCLTKTSEECLRNLPPPLRKRLRKILTDHFEAILFCRASVVRERRGDGRVYWRLYLESGSREHRKRKRVYIGPQGGPELREAVLSVRRAFWGDYGGPKGFLKAQMKQTARTAREARKAARSAREALLAQTYRHSHGRMVRNRRSVPAKQRYRAEYRHMSIKALQEATWAGITEDEYVRLRKVGTTSAGNTATT